MNKLYELTLLAAEKPQTVANMIIKLEEQMGKIKDQLIDQEEAQTDPTEQLEERLLYKGKEFFKTLDKYLDHAMIPEDEEQWWVYTAMDLKALLNKLEQRS